MSWFTAFNFKTVLKQQCWRARFIRKKFTEYNSKNLERNTQLFANLWKDFLFHLIQKFNNFRFFFFFFFFFGGGGWISLPVAPFF